MPRTKMSDGVRVQLTTEEENIIIAEEAESKLRDEKYLKVKYKDDRKMAYDPIPEQLDQIYHDMDGWKARIKSIKDKFPKP
jgi:uncharacterized protein YhaN